MHRLATVHERDNQPTNQRPTTNDVTIQPRGWWEDFEDTLIRFDRIHERDRQIDRRIDKQTDRQRMTA